MTMMSAEAHPRRASAAFVQLRSGACVDLLHPDLAPASLEDVATALSRTARFNGHTRGEQAYSVAQHSVHVAETLRTWGYSEHVCRAGLFHDAAEALIGDVVTPVKRLLGPAWTRLEKRAQSAVRRRFNISVAFDHPAIAIADMTLLATEQRDLLATPAWTWGASTSMALQALRITAWPASVAYARWLAAAQALDGGSR